MREEDELKVLGAILPLGCTFLSTGAKTVWGLLQPPLRELGLISNSRIAWPTETLMPFLSFSENSFRMHTIFKKKRSVDNFEIVYKSGSILVWGAVTSEGDIIAIYHHTEQLSIGGRVVFKRLWVTIESRRSMSKKYAGSLHLWSLTTSNWLKTQI